jgi:hypothetical protein
MCHTFIVFNGLLLISYPFKCLLFISFPSGKSLCHVEVVALCNRGNSGLSCIILC